MNNVNFSPTRATSGICNQFDNHANEIILDHIGPYLTPKEALSARLVNRRFAVLFGDSHIWRTYYRTRGLEAPAAIPNTTNDLLISNLAKKFPLWTCLQKVIDSEVKSAGENVFSLKFPRSLCITALAIPELFPLHSYAIKILEEHCRIPTGLSVDELLLRVARGDKGFCVKNGARILALQSLSKRAAEPAVREALLSVTTTKYRYVCSDSLFCREAVKGLLPYLADVKVQRAILICLQQHDPFTVRAALDNLITNPKFLNAVVDRFAGGLSGLDKIVRNHLNNAFVVEQLVQRLSEENDLHIVCLLVRALEPIADQKQVQRALCQKLVDLQPDRSSHVKNALTTVIYNSRLDSDVKEEYYKQIPILQNQASADVILQLASSDFVGNRQRLLTALSSQNTFERAAAATVLAPLVPDDPEILAAFLNRIYQREHGDVGIIIVSTLAKAAYRKDIRNALIQEGPLDGRLSSTLCSYISEQRLATVQALRPFVSEPEVREAFLKRLESDDCSMVRCTLIDILAPQLGKQDVQTLFLKAAKDELWRQDYHSGSEWQVAAIDKLGSIADIPEVKSVILDLFKSESFSVKAACIRALCKDKQRPLIGLDKIFIACIDSCSEVRKEARRVLARALYLR